MRPETGQDPSFRGITRHWRSKADHIQSGQKGPDRKPGASATRRALKREMRRRGDCVGFWKGMETARDRDRVYREMRMYVVGALADIQATEDIGKRFIEDDYGADAHWVAERIVQLAIPDAPTERVEEVASAIEASVAAILDELWQNSVIERVPRETAGVMRREMPAPAGGYRYRLVGPERLREIIRTDKKP